MNALREECQQLRDELIALRREFHRAPELGLHEYHTAARIERELDRCGIPHERVGHLTGNGNGSGLVVLRADIDALPIQETNDVPYRSQMPGMMHACGHDAHTTCLLGAAKVLSAHRALSLSGDDFAEYLLQTKGAYAYLGTANPKKPHTCISNHRGDFDIDEETLPLGAALYAAYALSVLDPQFAK